jgi:hypothetical protein
MSCVGRRLVAFQYGIMHWQPLLSTGFETFPSRIPGLLLIFFPVIHVPPLDGQTLTWLADSSQTAAMVKRPCFCCVLVQVHRDRQALRSLNMGRVLSWSRKVGLYARPHVCACVCVCAFVSVCICVYVCACMRARICGFLF